MNIKRHGHVEHITLSRRNLETLLQMLDQHVGQPILHRMINVSMASDGEISRVMLLVQAEENEEHYANRRTKESN